MAYYGLNGLDFSYNSETNYSNCLHFSLSCSFSEGQALETVARYSMDATSTSQSIVRRRYKMAKTYSISYNITHIETDDILHAIYAVEDSVRSIGMLYYNGSQRGLVVVTGVSITPVIDALGEFVSAAVTLNISSAKIPKAHIKTEVRHGF